jgi:hypothetical protein
MNFIATRSILVAVALLAAGIADAATCQELEHSSAPQQIDYLRQSRSRLRTECVQYAIARLGQPAYLPAADLLVSAAGVLVSYLDFRVAGPRPTPDILDHLPPLIEEFPAVHALSSIGLPATGSLVRAIGSVESSALFERMRRMCSQSSTVTTSQAPWPYCVGRAKQRRTGVNAAGSSTLRSSSQITVTRICARLV